MSLLSSDHVYRCAVALNNIGVDLLERKFYEEALVTLADATTAMRTLQRTLSKYESMDDHNIHATKMMERANKRTSRPLTFERNQSHSLPQDENTVNPIRIDDANPIRIDDANPDWRCPSNIRDPNVQVAIVLHNYAHANLCVARTTHSQHIRDTRFDNARVVFEFANSILEQQGSQTEDELTLRQLAALNVAVLLGLSKSCESIEVTQAMYDRLHTLHSTIQDLDDYLCECAFGIHSAAAA
jgi:hypothetical protein